MGKKPEDVLGIPVVFNDRAAIPVVGDFRYSRQNYDIDAIYETDKDGKMGEHSSILTAWGDHRIHLKSAFWLTKVAAEDAGAEISITNGDAAVGNGTAATWADGENTLTITVTNGDSEKIYTVTVTKETT